MFLTPVLVGDVVENSTACLKSCCISGQPGTRRWRLRTVTNLRTGWPAASWCSMSGMRSSWAAAPRWTGPSASSSTSWWTMIWRSSVPLPLTLRPAHLDRSIVSQLRNVLNYFNLWINISILNFQPSSNFQPKTTKGSKKKVSNLD